MDNAFESESKKSFIEFARSLRRDRDRLVIQLNLAQKEVRDEWERIEDKWDEFEHAVASASKETKDRVNEAGEDIREAYRKLENKVGLG